MTDNNPNGDDFVNAQYDENGGVQEVPEGGFVEGQYDDQQVMATSWVCEYCQVENGLDTTECSGCGYDYAAGDEGYTDENGVYHDSTGGWYDEEGLYHDADGGYYDEKGQYHDAQGGYWDLEGVYYDADGGHFDALGEYHPPKEGDTVKGKPFIPKKAFTVCQTCFHKHYWGEFCHVFFLEVKEPELTEEEKEQQRQERKKAKETDMFATDSDDDDDDGSGFEGSDLSEEEEDIEDEDSEARLLRELNAKKEAQVAKSAAAEGALGVPECVAKCGFIRCNCRDGVKPMDFDYIPLPKPFMAGFTRILTYEVQKEKQHTLYRPLKSDKKLEYCNKLNKLVAPFIPNILSYLPLAQCAPTAITCTHWNKGANESDLYRNMRDATPWIVIRPHRNQTDSILRIGDKVYSGGDRRVYVSDANTGEVLHMMTRDTGSIPTLIKVDETIYCCSNQGAIRVFNLMHNVKRIYLDMTMWEHSRRITEILFEKRSVGNCELHGIEDHVCRMYTVSEDRMIVVWDTNKHCPVKSIKPRLLKDNIINSITMTDRHFICGTSAGTIQVYSKTDVCERTDIHNCLVSVNDRVDDTAEIGRVIDPKSLDHVDRKWCLQLTLRTPNTKDFADITPQVNFVLVTGPNFTDGQLHCADSTGRHTMWRIPDKGLEFIPVKTHTPHTKGITGMRNTRRHLVTASEDGTIVFMDLTLLTQIRRIDVLHWCLDKGLITDDSENIPREIKCMHLMVDENNGGTLSVGTSYGEVMLMDIGTTV